MKYATILAASALMLQGCAGTPTLKDITQTLKVYPENRIGYVITSRDRGSSFSARVWSTTNQILALRFQNQLINAKDIDSVETIYTGKRYTPLTVNVTLKSGERLVAQIADWGSELYDGKLEWVACTTGKICEYVNRTATASLGSMTFPGFPGLLTAVTDGAIYNAATDKRTTKTAKDIESHDLKDALPSSTGSYRIKFQPIEIVSDIQSPLQKARMRQEALSKCAKETVRKEDLERRAHEEKVLRSNPTPQDLRLLQAWKLSQRSGFAQISSAQIHCQGQVPE
jgi:hypothetical protein